MFPSTMKTALLLISFSCVFSYPSKPLNERSTELAWEAWLLVDQSNRDLGVLRRRITPKSVFIAPTFSPESLPACADGYKSDSMGRCIKIIKINESVHFDFLLQKLNERFPDYEEEVEEVSTQGPLQFNIPLVDNDEEILVENETDVAIVMTPSSKKHQKNSIKVDVKRNGGDKFNTIENVAAIIGVNPEDVTMTTLSELTTTTTMSQDTTTTFETTTTTTTTISDETTTLLEGDAIFFQWRI